MLLLDTINYINFNIQATKECICCETSFPLLNSSVEFYLCRLVFKIEILFCFCLVLFLIVLVCVCMCVRFCSVQYLFFFLLCFYDKQGPCAQEHTAIAPLPLFLPAAL